MRTRRNSRLAALTLLLMRCAWGEAWAQFVPQATAAPGSVPSGVSYQGRLEEAGAPVSGAKSMQFRVFSVPTGGAALYDSGPQTVVLNGGVFSVVLDIPLGVLAGGSTRYVEIQVDTTVLAPRDPLTSVPYAKVAEAVQGSIEISTGGFTLTNPGGTVLFVSSVTAQVGIGTGSPAAGTRLHILGGDLVVGDPSSLGGGTAGEDLFVEGNVVVDGAVSFQGGSFLTLGVSTDIVAGQLFAVGNGTFTVLQGGEVGVGTSTPGTTLEVQSAVVPAVRLNHATNPRIEIEVGGASRMALDHDGSLGLIGTTSATDMTLVTSDTERLRVAAGGNVGVGTTNPLRLLDVNGTLRANILETASLGAVGAPAVIVGGDANTGLYQPGADMLAVTTGGTERLRIDASGNTGLGAAAGAGERLRVEGGDVVIGNPGIVGGSAAEDLFIEGNLIVDGQSILQSAQFADLAISTGLSAGQLFKVGAGTFTVLSTGLVGVGTTNPAFTLEVQAATNPGLVLDHLTNPQLQLRRAGSSVFSASHDGTNGAFGTTTATDLVLRTNGTERLRISDSTGRVGISSAVPTAPLSVGGNMAVSGALTLGAPLSLALGGTGAATAANARTALSAVDRGGTEATTNSLWDIRISSTAAEAAMLEYDPANCVAAGEFPKGVDAQGNAQNCTNVAAGEESTIEGLIYDTDNNLSTIGSAWSVASSGVFDIEFDSADDTFFIDVSADRVGVGTTSPGHTLDVQGGNVNASGKLREGGNDLIPSGTILFFNLASCPGGWTSFAASTGRAIVGVPAAGTVMGSVGTALTNLQDATHTHDLQNHTHNVDPDGGGHTHGLNSHTHDTDPDGAGHVHGLNTHTHSVDPDGGGHTHTLSNHTHDVNPANTTSTGPSSTANDSGGGATTYADGAHTHDVNIGNTASTMPSTNTSGSTNLGSVSSGGPSTANTTSTNLASATSGGPDTANTTSTNLGSVASGAPSTNATSAVSHTMPYLQLTVCSKN